ncbi:MAG: Trk system potassium transporter TrkA [Clostridia bacterium]|nr:Trk system potassium transporter TrkA [Clostridia bacterium]
MNIIIVSDGQVGYTLAEYLSRDGHDITLVDKSRRALQKASETLDVLCVLGSGANLRTLIEAGAEAADIIIAATTNDELNMVSCLAAKQLGAKYAIARVRDPEYTESLTLLQDKLDIDQAINPERATAQEISRLMRFPFAINVESFAHGRVEMVEFRVEKSDRIDSVPLSHLHGRYPHVQFNAVLREGEAIIPGGGFEIHIGDRLYVTGDRVSVTAFFKQLGRDTQRAKNAILIGGGHVSYYLAKTMAGMGIHLKIVEVNEEKCKSLSETLDNAVVINGDGTDRELLESENIRDHDALICLTDRDEENLVTGLYGVRLGMRKVIVKINRLETMDIIGDMGIDSVVSPKLATANVILRAVRARSHSQSSVIEKVYPLLANQAEAYEFVALSGGSYLNIPLNRLSLKRGVLVSMIVRGRQIIIPFGSDHIEAGDTVILTALAGTMVDLKDAFDATER